MTRRAARCGTVALAGVVLTLVPARAAGPFRFHSLSPCRLIDTRTPTGGPVLGGNQTRCFTVRGLCGVPPEAQAVIANVTAVGPTGPGYITLFPCGPRPIVSSVNYNAGEPALGNGTIVPLCDEPGQPDFCAYVRVAASGGTVHMVLDLTGYFSP
jgi:hypothetical protein